MMYEKPSEVQYEKMDDGEYDENSFRPWIAGVTTVLLTLTTIAFVVYGIISFVEFYKYRNGYVNYQDFSIGLAITFGILTSLWVLMLLLDFIFGSSENFLASKLHMKSENFVGKNMKDFYQRTSRDFFFYFVVYAVLAFLTAFFSFQMYLTHGKTLINYQAFTFTFLKIEFFLALMSGGTIYHGWVLMSIIGKIYSHFYKNKQT